MIEAAVVTLGLFVEQTGIPCRGMVARLALASDHEYGEELAGALVQLFQPVDGPARRKAGQHRAG